MAEINFGLRIIASGTTLVATGTIVTLATFTRGAGERLFPAVAMNNDAAAQQIAWDTSAGAAGSLIYLEKTANANEFLLRLENNEAADRTYDWAVLGVLP